MKIRESVRIASIVAAISICAGLSAAQETSQDTSLGDIARKARADKADSPHAGKVVTNEDFGPHLVPIAENEDPADVVNKAHAAIVADTLHTCHREISNNSGPGSTTESVTEVAAPDRGRMVIDRRGGPGPGHTEMIVIGTDVYYRDGTGPWQKTAAATRLPTASPFSGVPDGLSRGYTPGLPTQGPWGTNIHFVQRETINGVPTFLYEDQFHPGGVGIRTQTDDIWVGANDHLPRKAQTVLVESAPGTAPITQRDTMTCSYGSAPKIDPPM